MADLKQHFGLTEEDMVDLNPETMPKGSRFVSVTNKLYEITDWGKDATGTNIVILKQGEVGVENLDEYKPTNNKKWPISCYKLSAPEPVAEEADLSDGLGDDLDDIEETPGASAPDEFGDDATEEDGAQGETVDDEAAAAEEAIGDEFIDEKIDVPVVDDISASDDDDAEVDELSAASGDDGAEVAAAIEASPPKKITEWDGRRDHKNALIFDCAKRCMTISEIAQLCIDGHFYTEHETAMQNVRRSVRLLITKGYGLMFVGDENNDLPNARVHLTHDGVTPFVPPVEEIVADKAAPGAGDGSYMAHTIRERLGITDPTGLPTPLAEALLGIADNAMGLSPAQLQGITLLAYGVALIVGGRDAR